MESVPSRTPLQVRFEGSSTLHRRSDAGLAALEHIRPMRGGAQSHLMRCSDSNYYVVKFQNNPQGSRILANELLGANLAKCLRLPVACGKTVFVHPGLIRLTEEMTMELPCKRMPCQPGSCFGSRLPVDPRFGSMFDFLPEAFLLQAENLGDFLGMLVFDLWTGNSDQRQVIFCRNSETAKYRAVMIDQGFCFGGSAWNFDARPEGSLYWRNKAVYAQVQGMDDFEPWLKRLEEEVDEQTISAAASEITADWYNSDTDELGRLLQELDRRRNKIRELLWSVKRSYTRPFPNWVSDEASRNRVSPHKYLA